MIHYLEMFVAATLVLGFPSVAMAQTITFADAAISSTSRTDKQLPAVQRLPSRLFAQSFADSLQERI